MRQPRTQRGALTPRRQLRTGCPVMEKLVNYQRNIFFLPAVMTTSGRISGDFLRLLYILSHRRAANYFTCMASLTHNPRHTNNERVLLFQSRRHRHCVRPGHRNEDRHRPTQAPPLKGGCQICSTRKGLPTDPSSTTGQTFGLCKSAPGSSTPRLLPPPRPCLDSSNQRQGPPRLAYCRPPPPSQPPPTLILSVSPPPIPSPTCDCMCRALHT